MTKHHYILIFVAALILAWWFRYDTHCGGNARIACVAYDRFTGEWILPIEKAIEKADE